ncbi:MAG: 4Fe-4S dicluster domain-containing protein [Dehalococcoidales bacterium]|nr:MAG: 4Fe-4S dicluster domain-containing protein [Dehalococcoidales bacterium]
MTTDVSTIERHTSSRKWIWVRRSSQAFFLVLFSLLLILTIQGISGRLPYDLFFHLDPLNGIVSMISARTVIIPMLLGLITIVSAIIIGRAWCGWVCPLGTVFDWIPSRRTSVKGPVSSRWSKVKYMLLIAVLFGAILGGLTLNILDPITLLFRTVAGAIIPGLAWLIEGAESWLYGFEALRSPLEWIDGLLRGWLLNNQPFYLPNLILLGVFIIILGLNFVRSRFWCRYLCPLGGLLGLISKVSIFQHSVDNDTCIACRKCVRVCYTGAIDPDNGFTANMPECTVCMNCREGCPTNAISFKRENVPVKQTDMTRRGLLYSLGAGLALGVVARYFPRIGKRNHDKVRPPGSTEETLYEQCIRCGECVRICPSGGIQPLSSPGDGMLWTPFLDTRLGYCEYGCNSCGIICPTEAIENLSLEEKRERVIGIAYVDRERCIPWSENTECIVCEEMCPIPAKAIVLKGGQGFNSSRVQRPHVVVDLCNGCGICEHQCPVEGNAAIKIYTKETVPEQIHDETD